LEKLRRLHIPVPVNSTGVMKQEGEEKVSELETGLKHEGNK
jgi:hypothetical protein